MSGGVERKGAQASRRRPLSYGSQNGAPNLPTIYRFSIKEDTWKNAKGEEVRSGLSLIAVQHDATITFGSPFNVHAYVSDCTNDKHAIPAMPLDAKLYRDWFVHEEWSGVASCSFVPYRPHTPQPRHLSSCVVFFRALDLNPHGHGTYPVASCSFVP